MIGVRDLINKLNDELTNPSLTELEINQLYAAIDSLERKGVSSVSNVSSLPNPVTNKGRFFFIQSEDRYVYSNGVTWSINNLFRPALVNIYGWGRNNYGQIGDNTTTPSSSPVSIAGNISNWTSVSGSFSIITALRTDGTAWGWGPGNTYGAIGDGTTINRSSPVPVVGGITNWVQLTSGTSHSVGLRADGTLWAWGRNNSGQLGTNNTTNFSSPVSVVGGFTWTQVSAGNNFTIGIRSNGTLWGWGTLQNGVLGIGLSSGSRISPVQIGTNNNWILITTGTSSDTNGPFSLGLRADGTLWGWGGNQYAQLGIGTSGSTTANPTQVAGGFTDWVQASAGAGVTGHGIRANGTAWSWGQNANGQLGDGTTTNRSSPVSVVGGFTDWVQISAGGVSTLGLRANGTAWAWGNRYNGALGDGLSSGVVTSPVSVVGGFTDWIQVNGTFRGGFGVRG